MKNLLIIALTTIFAVNLFGNIAFAEGRNAGPIAYATVADDGTIYSGTPNVSVAWNALGAYEVTIADENYNFHSYSTVVTVNGSAPVIATVNSNNSISNSRVSLKSTAKRLLSVPVDCRFPSA